MKEIRLPLSNWFFDPLQLLGPPGGFGAVYKGHSPSNESVAIKELDINIGDFANRELRIANSLASQNLNHVIPIYDSGQDTESGRHYIVMAVADQSLQQVLTEIGPHEEPAIVDILRQISLGLAELSGLVHRDLKPGNVLSHQGAWKLADFGIAKFVEDSTSEKTLNKCMSFHYAAPEQWKHEHVDGAADIYALGCIAYALLTGRPPFMGSEEELRECHLHKEPPALPRIVSPRLQTLLSMLLRKAPGSRPSLPRLQTILNSIEASSEDYSYSPVAAAASRIERTRALAEAKRLEDKARLERRNDLADGGRIILDKLSAGLYARIQDAAPICELKGDGVIVLEKARMYSAQGKDTIFVQENSFPQSQIDIILSARIIAGQKRGNITWASSLFYAALPGNDRYRWYEVGFFATGSELSTPQDALDLHWPDPDYKHIDATLAGTSETMFMAFGPTPIDDENASGFFNRWETLFALASEDLLKREIPQKLSEDYWTEFVNREEG